MLYAVIIQFGRITSDVVRDGSVTDFTTVGHIATLFPLISTEFLVATIGRPGL